MAEKKYRVILKGFRIESCEGEDAGHSHQLMTDSESVTWENLSYEDLCKFEAVMMDAVTGALKQLGLEELDKKKSKKG